MESRVAAALSSRAIRVDPQSPAGDARERIAHCRATHIAVVDVDRCLGIYRIEEMLDRPPRQAFSELVGAQPPAGISRDRSLDDAARLLMAGDVEAVPVLDEQGRFVGVATRESLLGALAEHNRLLLEERGQLLDRQELLLRQNAEINDRDRRSRRLLGDLAHAGRISTMSEMASGLAHELNQPLAAIVAYVDACQELVESGRMNSEQLLEVLRSVSGQADRAGQIIHRLRKMIKRSQPVRAPLNLNDAVREVADLLEAEAREVNVNILLELDQDLPEPAADFRQIQQVVLHLVQNGLEAMTGIAADQRFLTISTNRTPAGEVEVAVRDLGSGLPEDVAGRVFEPFFTTKANGLGFGLSISRTIVDAHGGRIWIVPEPPHGVVARFTLPASPGKASHGPESDRVHRR
jgi:C4-dicarboxylate-specific signal transduction histidine kinase